MSNLKQLEALGRKTWLAGLGALDSTKSFATKKVDDALTNTNELVSELIEKGEKVEADVQEKVNKNLMLDQRVAALKQKLGLSENSTDEKVDELTAKVDALFLAVNELIAQEVVDTKSEKKAPAKTAKKTTTTKATTSK
jgi:ribosome assembly protein YihI (activator of Der GTPase)